MRVLRVLGLLFFIGALVMLGREAWAWHQSGHWTFIPAGRLWFEIDKNSLLLIQPALERHVWPLLWDPVLTTILQWPAWAVLGGIAVVLHLLGQMMARRRRLFRWHGLKRRRD